MAILAKFIENELINGRHHLSKAIIPSILRYKWKTVQNGA